MMTLRGVLPVFQTPFTDDERIDFDALEREVDWIVTQGAQGIVFGMVSEALRLTDAERGLVVRAAAARAAAAGLPCVASVGGESTRIALGRVVDAIAAGASALMATPPLNGRHTEDELHEYFRAILALSSASDVPVVVQDASGYLGQKLSQGMQSALFAEFGEAVMFKPEAVPFAPTLAGILELTGGRARIFEGMGAAALPETFPLGVAGTMPGAEVCWAVVAMWEALTAGDDERAKRIRTPLLALLALQTDLDSFVVCEKFLLVEQGVLQNATARSPLGYTLSESDATELRRALGELRKAVDAR